MDRISRLRTNVSENNWFKTVGNANGSINVDACADWLVEELNSPGSRAFYCKVAMRLDASTIDDFVVKAKRGYAPPKLFNYLANKEMKHREDLKAVYDYESDQAENS